MELNVVVQIPQLDRLAAALELLANRPITPQLIEHGYASDPAETPAASDPAPTKRGRKPRAEPAVEQTPGPVVETLAPEPETVEAPKPEPVPEPAPTPPAPAPAPVEHVAAQPAAASPSESITLDDVRARAVPWSKAHTRDELMAVLGAHGLSTLVQARDKPEVWPALYAAFAPQEG